MQDQCVHVWTKLSHLVDKTPRALITRALLHIFDMKNSLYLFILLFGSFFSCERNKNNGVEQIYQIPVNPQGNIDLSFSDFFDTTLIVPLEVTPNSLIGEVSKVITTDEFIYVLDRTIAESLFVFDYQGRLLNYFSGTGGGPSEYLRVSNFFISKDETTIFITDLSLGKILAFDQKGNFLFENKFVLGENFADLITYQNGFLIAKPTPDDLAVDLQYLDHNLKFVEVPFKLAENNFIMEAGNKHQFFYPGTGGVTYFKEVLSKNLYAITPDDVQVYAFNLPEDQVFSPEALPWDNEKPKIHMGKVYSEIRERSLLNVGDQVLDLGSWVLINFHVGDRINLLAFNKTDKTARVVKNFTNDLDGLVKNLPGIFPTNYHANEMIINLFPNDIYAALGTSEESNPYLDYLTKLMPQLEENPVLFIYRKKNEQ
ncbi:MAG: hypothetical protein C0433_20475 [Cyclobacterium sp.]|nr:hypothetical protein [Cyclobacterium sp.]